MSIRDRLASGWNSVAAEFNARHSPGVVTNYYSSPNTPADVTPASGGSAMPNRRGLPLDTFASTVLDGSGNGRVPLGPQIVREHWQPGAASVSVATNVKEASCVLYLGSSPQSSTQIAQTSKGSSGATCPLSGDMPSGYQLFAVWSGGDPGSTATMRVTGSRSIGAPS